MCRGHHGGWAAYIEAVDEVQGCPFEQVIDYDMSLGSGATSEEAPQYMQGLLRRNGRR